MTLFKRIINDLYLFIQLHFQDRFGPDLPFTHWLLYIKFTREWFVKRKIHYIGRGAEVRPYVTVSGGKNIIIGDNVVVRPFSSLRAGDTEGKILIEEDVLLGPNIWISVNVHKYKRDCPILNQGYEKPRDVLIKSGAWIGKGATILPGVTIGRNSTVAAEAVVTRNVPDHCLVAGNPACVIKEFNLDK